MITSAQVFTATTKMSGPLYIKRGLCSVSICIARCIAMAYIMYLFVRWLETLKDFFNFQDIHDTGCLITKENPQGEGEEKQSQTFSVLTKSVVSAFKFILQASPMIPCLSWYGEYINEPINAFLKVVVQKWFWLLHPVLMV